jgi:hypothetical protein
MRQYHAARAFLRWAHVPTRLNRRSRLWLSRVIRGMAPHTSALLRFCESLPLPTAYCPLPTAYCPQFSPNFLMKMATDFAKVDRAHQTARRSLIIHDSPAVLLHESAALALRTNSVAAHNCRPKTTLKSLSGED